MPTAADASPGAATGAASAPRPDRGRVVAARGSVLDVEFLGHLPAIREALAVEWDVGAPLIAEVQQHLEPRRVRIGRVLQVGDGVAMIAGLPDTRLDELLDLVTVDHT